MPALSWCTALLLAAAPAPADTPQVFTGHLHCRMQMGSGSATRTYVTWAVSDTAVAMNARDSVSLIAPLMRARQSRWHPHQRLAYYRDDLRRQRAVFTGLADSCYTYVAGGRTYPRPYGREGFVGYLPERAVQVPGRSADIAGETCDLYAEDRIVWNPYLGQTETVALQYWVARRWRAPFVTVGTPHALRVPFAMPDGRLILHAVEYHEGAVLSEVRVEALDHVPPHAAEFATPADYVPTVCCFTH